MIAMLVTKGVRVGTKLLWCALALAAQVLFEIAGATLLSFGKEIPAMIIATPFIAVIGFVLPWVVFALFRSKHKPIGESSSADS